MYLAQERQSNLTTEMSPCRNILYGCDKAHPFFNACIKYKQTRFKHHYVPKTWIYKVIHNEVGDRG